MKTKHVFEIIDKIAIHAEPVGQARVAAAIVLKNDIISLGWNRRKSHPLQKRFAYHEDQIYMHAEIDAIRSSLRHITPAELARAKLYVTRFKFKNSESNLSKDRLHRGLAKPCPGCASAIAAFDIKHVCFSTEDGEEWI